MRPPDAGDDTPIARRAARVRMLQRLQIDKNASPERVLACLNDEPAPRATVEALMYGLRERGLAALRELPVQRRLYQLDEEQMGEVVQRLLRPPPHAKPWPHEDVQTVVRKRMELKHENR